MSIPSRIPGPLLSRFNRLLLLEQLLKQVPRKIHVPARLEARLGESKRKLKREILAILEATGPGTMRPVPERPSLSPEEFRREFFSPGLPVVLRGAAREWECVRKWSLDYLSLAHGGEDILIVDAEGLTESKTPGGYEFLTLRELIENIRAGGSKYLRFSPLLQSLPVLEKDIDLEWLGRFRPRSAFGRTYYAFVGGKGTRTLLHNDQPCNLFIQAHGRKKWLLYPMWTTPIVDPEVSKTAYFNSPIDPENPDFDRFPMFRHIDGYEITLEPGDVMYVPPHFWHHVSNQSDTIGVGYRFSSLAAAWSASPTFTLLRALSMNPPLWKTSAYGKVDTNLIWAHASGIIGSVLAEKEARAARRRLG